MAVANPVISDCINTDSPSYIFTIEITEVLARNILYHANGLRDLLNLSITCRHYYAQIAHLWKKLLHSAFPEEKITKYMLENKCYSYKLVYWELLKRSRIVTGMEIGGAWITTPQYYQRDGNTAGSISNCPLYLITVCWLENGAWFNDVYPGKYEIIWRVKQEKHYSPIPDAEIFYTRETAGAKDKEVPLGKIYKYEPATVNQWVEVSTGCISMEKRGRLNSRFQSLVPNWQGRMWFDCVQLKPLPF